MTQKDNLENKETNLINLKKVKCKPLKIGKKKKEKNYKMKKST